MQEINISNIKALIFDMDGVIWRGDEPIGDLGKLFQIIQEKGYSYLMATNNATLPLERFIDKLKKFNIPVEPWQIVNSSLATAHYLCRQFPNGGPLFIVGENGLVVTLSNYGFYHSENNVLAVVAGLDRSLTYEKIKNASLFIQSGIPFIGTNMDPSLPTPEGLIPGAGTIIGAIEIASGCKPRMIGKPEPEIYLLAMERLQTSPDETLVIGDRLETDIAGAQNSGCRTCLVLSGVATIETAKSWHPKPDIITQDVSSLVALL